MVVFVFMTVNSVMAQSNLKVGANTMTIGTSAVLELEATNKGFLPPRMTTTQRNAIGSPAVGLAIYNTTTNCYEWYDGSAWVNSCNDQTISLATNGSAVVTDYSCATASAGTLTQGVPVSGVTQTITATVTTIGTYNISTITNGVTFAASGTFTSTGAQNIVLTATGTPLVNGINSFTLNTSPNCNFNWNVASF